jgi:hypothetical protein
LSRSCRELDSIRDVLVASIGSRVTIILSSGRILRGVEVEAVDGDLVIVSFDGRIITINIRRIDAVITRCRRLLGTLLSRRCRREFDPGSREEFEGSCGFESRRRGEFESSRRFESRSRESFD